MNEDENNPIESEESQPINQHETEVRKPKSHRLKNLVQSIINFNKSQDLKKKKQIAMNLPDWDQKKESYFFDQICDQVRVNIAENDNYLREILLGFHKLESKTDGSTIIYDMLQISQEELRQYEIENKNGSFVYVNTGEIATTIKKVTKGYLHSQAFVMSTDGHLYIGTHNGKYNKDGKPNLSHASFLQGKAAEFAGILRINNEGKIVDLINESGHYRPDELDMYRGIKKLMDKDQRLFSDNCKVFIMPTIEYDLGAFIEYMEEVEVNTGKLRHELMRQNRLEKIRSYRDSLVLGSKNMNISEKIEITQALLNIISSRMKDKNYMTNLVENLDKAGKLKQLVKAVVKSHSYKKSLDFNLDGGTPFFLRVAERADITIVKKFLEEGADINSVDRYGQTALMRAVITENEVIVKFLIENGANVTVVDNQGNQASDLALYINNENIISIIENKKKSANNILNDSYHTQSEVDELNDYFLNASAFRTNKTESPVNKSIESSPKKSKVKNKKKNNNPSERYMKPTKTSFSKNINNERENNKDSPKRPFR